MNWWQLLQRREQRETVKSKVKICFVYHVFFLYIRTLNLSRYLNAFSKVELLVVANLGFWVQSAWQLWRISVSNQKTISFNSNSVFLSQFITFCLIIAVKRCNPCQARLHVRQLCMFNNSFGDATLGAHCMSSFPPIYILLDDQIYVEDI